MKPVQGGKVGPSSQIPKAAWAVNRAPPEAEGTGRHGQRKLRHDKQGRGERKLLPSIRFCDNPGPALFASFCFLLPTLQKHSILYSSKRAPDSKGLSLNSQEKQGNTQIRTKIDKEGSCKLHWNTQTKDMIVQEGRAATASCTVILCFVSDLTWFN